MLKCWNDDPKLRPSLGDIKDSLEDLWTTGSGSKSQDAMQESRSLYQSIARKQQFNPGYLQVPLFPGCLWTQE
jgi:hypothetical protein